MKYGSEFFPRIDLSWRLETPVVAGTYVVPISILFVSRLVRPLIFSRRSSTVKKDNILCPREWRDRRLALPFSKNKIVKPYDSFIMMHMHNNLKLLLLDEHR